MEKIQQNLVNMICKNCKTWYQQGVGRHTSYTCPHCGASNFGLDKSTIISLIIAAIIFLSIYLYNSYYA